jgi:hypothetical protein
MKRLEFRLGNRELDREKFEYCGNDPADSYHKCLVVGNGVALYAFVAPGGHIKIIKKNKIETARVLGGGSIYLNREGHLVLDHLSYMYGAVPSKVACEFAKLIQEELKKMSLKGEKAIVNTKGDLKEKWTQYGFNEQVKDKRKSGK